MAEKDRTGIQSIEVGFPILEALSESAKPLSLTQIAAVVGMSPSKAHRYLVSFLRVGVVQQAGQGGSYDLGPGALRLGFAALRRVDILSCSESVMKSLRDAVDESVTLAIWSPSGPLIVRFMENSSPVSVNVRVGSVMPLLTSALGRVYLAWAPWNDLEPLLAAELLTQAARASGANSLDDVKDMREQVLADGFAKVSSAMFHGVAAISAPVFDHLGTIRAAVAVVGADARLADPHFGEIIQRKVRAAAREISSNLGGSESRVA